MRSCWIFPLVLTISIQLYSADHVQYACPRHSWCLPRLMCPADDILDTSSTPYVCEDNTQPSGHFVCCSSQDGLPKQFQPSTAQWYYSGVEQSAYATDDTVTVLPWPDSETELTHVGDIGDRYMLVEDDNSNDDSAVEPGEYEGELPVMMISETEIPDDAGYDEDEHDEHSSRDVEDLEPRQSSSNVQEYDISPVCSGQVCPARSLCVPWLMCDSQDMMNYNSGSQSDYLCGNTADTLNSVCCRSNHLLHTMTVLRAAAQDSKWDSSAPQQSPDPPSTNTAVPVAPLSLQQLADAYSVFTPPPQAEDDDSGDPDMLPRVRYLQQVLFGGAGSRRSRRDLSALVQRAASVRLGELDVPASGADKSATTGPVHTEKQSEFHATTVSKDFGVPEDTTLVTNGDQRDHQETELDLGAVNGESVDSTDSSIKPARAPILDGKTDKDGDVNGRSTFGAFLDDLLDVSPSKHAGHPEDETTKKQQHTESAGGREENVQDSSKHHQPPVGFPALFPPQPVIDTGSLGGPSTAHKPRPVLHRPPYQHRPSQFFQPPPPRPPLVHHHPANEPEKHHLLPDHLLPKTCGRSSSLGIHARITGGGGGGSYAQYGQFPWHVAVLLADDLSYKCAGVLVAPRAVITVAHCVTAIPTHRRRLLARVGDWDLSDDKEFYPAYDVPVDRYAIHPDYYSGSLLNDIAVLTLSTAVEGLPHVQPACLPSPAVSFVGRRCAVSGWGQAQPVSAGHHHDGRSYSWRLRVAQLTVVSTANCQRQLRKTRLGHFYQLPRRGALCAVGGHGKDACFGDGGGGLVCRDDHKSPYHVAGLVSWGIGCGQDIPGVYTKVSDYYYWILEQIERISTPYRHHKPHHGRVFGNTI